MQELNEDYLVKLETIAESIQNSELLSTFLESEEEEDYRALQSIFEPRISELYYQVAKENPLQILMCEKVLLNPAFEGLFLPRILGYAVLRGHLNKVEMKYTRPQEHFKDIVVTICSSANFEIIKKRIGQSLQIGFSLSSDIWVTNLINQIENKRIRYFLQSQKLDKYRKLIDRTEGYNRYKKQFDGENFMTTDFPSTYNELKVLYPDILQFLQYRITKKLNNQSIHPELLRFIENPAFIGSVEHTEVLLLLMNFFNLSADEGKRVAVIFNALRKEKAGFSEQYLKILNENLSHNTPPEAPGDKRVLELLDKDIKDELLEYYELINFVHTKGYVHEDVMNAVRLYHNQHEGLSVNNYCLRKALFTYFKGFFSNLREKDYHDYFELNKIMTIYIKIFGNQEFNQDVQDLSMDYVNTLLRRYTDKRARDYQDIKKFVSSTYVDLGFLKEKEVTEMFKTRRKKKDA